MGSRPGASPTPHGCLLEEQNNLQPHWNVAAELGQDPLPSLLPARGCCPGSASHRLPKSQLPWPPWLHPCCWPGHPKAGGQQAIHAASSPGTGSTTQPLGPASPLKLSPSFLFGADDARAPPPPLFCRDHRSICCPHGGAPRQYHTGAEPQKTLLAALLLGSEAVPAAG